MDANNTLTAWRAALYTDDTRASRWVDLVIEASEHECLDAALGLAAGVRVRSEALEAVIRLQQIAPVDLIRRARDLVRLLEREGQRLNNQALGQRVRVLAPGARITQRDDGRHVELLGRWILADGGDGRWALWAPPYPAAQTSWLYRECWPLYEPSVGHNLGALVEAIYQGDQVQAAKLAKTQAWHERERARTAREELLREDLEAIRSALDELSDDADLPSGRRRLAQLAEALGWIPSPDPSPLRETVQGVVWEGAEVWRGQVGSLLVRLTREPVSRPSWLRELYFQKPDQTVGPLVGSHLVKLRGGEP